MASGVRADHLETKQYHNQYQDLHDIIGYKMVLNHGRLHHVMEWMFLIHTKMFFEKSWIKREEDMKEYLSHHSIK